MKTASRGHGAALDADLVRPVFRSLFADFLYSGDAVDILTAPPDLNTWSTGACLVLAEALVLWIGPPSQAAVLVDEMGVVQHAVAYHDGICIDANSAAPMIQCIRSLSQEYGMQLAFTRPLDPRACKHSGVPRDLARSQALADAISAAFGPATAHPAEVLGLMTRLPDDDRPSPRGDREREL